MFFQEPDVTRAVGMFHRYDFVAMKKWEEAGSTLSKYKNLN